MSNRSQPGHGGWLTVLIGAIAVSPISVSAQPPGRQITLGHAHTIQSAVLDEDREVQVALPESYGRTTIAYPVIFLLDGSSHLLHASATARFLADARNRIPEMIVVALPNTNRNRDLTPGPGAAAFQRVLAEEVIPWVERNYRAAPERILVGHSLGGSFAVHTFLNRAELFDAYVAASAPVWRYEGLDEDMKRGVVRAARVGAALYLTVGEHENDRLRAGVAKLAGAFESMDAGAAPAWSFLDMQGEDHSSTAQRSLYHVLETRYADWRFPFFEDGDELARTGGLKGLEAHYARVSTRFGFISPPPDVRLRQVARIYIEAGAHEEAIQLSDAYVTEYPVLAEAVVNLVGYDQLRRGQVEQAVRTFTRNVRAFPDSPNVYDSLGDAHCKAGDAAAGRRSYEDAARAAAKRSPPHPRLGWYKDKAEKGCG